jgi:signal transduction histidine kinase
VSPRAARGRLFRKYVVVFLLLVGGVLLVSSALDLYFSYQETKTALIRIEREQAVAAAGRIEQFVLDIERQVRWTTQAAFDDPAAAREQREIDYLRLLRNVPAIGEIRHLDAAGKEQLRVSRLALDAVGSQEDHAGTREFQAARSGATYYGAVHFRNESEPYMAIAVPAGEYGVEVTVADVNLKAIWDVISRIRIGTAGYAYVVDVFGRLIAHPDISLVLQKRDLSELPQVRAARAAQSGGRGDAGVGMVAAGLQGGQFLTAYAPIAPLGWLVFVEQPLTEAFAPLQASVIRGGALFALGLALSVLASVVLARRMVAPIRALQEGAARIGAGELGHRLEVRTGDELEALGEEFNRTATRLQESYAGLEDKVEARTRELRQALEEVRALSEVSQAVSSTLDLPTVLATIVNRATHLSGADAGVIYEYDEATTEFRLRATENLDEEIVQVLRTAPLRLGEATTTGRAAAARHPVEVPDMTEDQPRHNRVREAYIGAGHRALLAVPLLREEQIVGALTVTRKTAGAFTPATIALLEAFATQSVLAIQNARLFREIADKSRQLEVASRHKSEFLASMSHELRTPLNAILGFNEMILGEVYGEVPAELKEPLADIQNSGKHLLRLINNVLDLAKIEAGRMELALADYSVQDLVATVRSSLHPLAADKGLEFVATVPDDLPLAHGDAGRLTQCLMNLVGNALKFTRQGRVEIAVARQGDRVVFRVTDTGIGIAPDRMETVFSEFRQGDATIASEFGGTGLGLSITKKFVEMHRGRIWVESELGRGSTFAFAIPLRLDGGGPP